MSRSKLFLLVLILALPLGCATLLPVPDQAMLSRASLQWSDIKMSDLHKGRSLYVANCAACHELHLPSEHTPAHWEKVMVKMQKKAKIKDGDKDMILAYLEVNAASVENNPKEDFEKP